MQAQEHQQVVEAYIQAYNAFDVDGMVALLHPDIVFSNISGGVETLRTQGVSEFRAVAEDAKAAFTTRRQIVTQLEHRDNQVEVLIAYAATLAIGLPNGLQAGDQLQLQGKSVFTFEDGRIRTLADYS